LLFLFRDDAADVGVLAADTPAEDTPTEDVDKGDEGVEEVVATANKSGL
jgi:hypothetical protein